MKSIFEKCTNSYILQSLLLFVIYFISGKLPVLLSITPDFSSPIWPPAGIGLACVLLWNKRYMPSIFLGAIALNLSIITQNNFSSITLASIVTTTIIGSGALLQAFTGAYLIKSFMNASTKLIKINDIIIILALGGAIACLTNSLIGPLALAFSGVLTQENFFENAFTWWIGDTIGVALLTPIILLIYSSSSKLRKIIVTTPVLILLAITIFTFHNVKISTQLENQKEFDILSKGIIESFEKNLKTYINILLANKSFINASENVTYKEFSLFTQPLIENNPTIYSLSWSPKVTHEQRKAHTDIMHQQGFPLFTIKDRSSGEMKPSSKRDIYFPVTFISPYTGNEIAHGHDIFAPDKISSNARQKVLNVARDKAQAMSTSRISLVQQEGKYGLLIYQPVYNNNTLDGSVVSRQENLIGYTAGVFLLPSMLAPINKMAENAGMHMIVNDLQAIEDKKLLYDSRTADKKQAKESLPISDEAIKSISVLDVAGRDWEFTFIQKDFSKNKTMSWGSFWILSGGLIFTAIFSIFLLIISAHIETIQRSVKKVQREEVNKPIFIASLVSIMVLIVTVILWYKFEEQYKLSNKEVIAKQAYLVKQEITSKVNSSAKALNRLATRWESRQGIPQNEWDVDVSQLINDLDALTTVEWVDASYTVRRLMPFLGNEKLLGLNIDFDGDHRDALRIAEESDITTITPPIRIVQGYDAFVTYNPLYIDDHFDGFIVGIHNLEDFTRNAFPASFHELFNIRITDTGKNKVYDSLDHSFEKNWASSTIATLFNEQWEITLWPKKAFLEQRDSNFTTIIILLSGILFSLLIGFSTYTALISSYRSRLLYKRTISLEDARKERERLIARLSNSNEELESFAYIASHDLKSPLRAINNISQWLEEDLADINDTSKGHLALLRSRIKRMENFLDDLLSYSRAGRNIENTEIISADHLANDVVQLLNVPEGFKVEVSDNLKSINIPRMPLEQVFHNLISNALKHHDKEEDTIVIEGRDIGGFYEFSISDSGAGIPEEFHDKIFDMFKTLRPRDEIEGSGIGLALVKKILTNFGGSIRLESEVNKGTTFIFTWPKATP